MEPRPAPHQPLQPLRRSIGLGGSALTAALVSSLLLACSDQGPTDPSATEILTAIQAGDALTAQAAGLRGAGYAPGQILARFLPGSNRAAIATEHGASPVRQVIPDVWLLSVPTGAEEALASALARNPNVVFAEPDYYRVLDDPLCPTCSRPSDQHFEWQWNMHNDGDVDLGMGLVFPTALVDADIDWLEAFDYLGPTPTGAARIGILDTGIRATHEDFCGKSVIWKNFYDPASTVPLDDHGHGTHVSGIAGACGDNAGRGVVGVAYGPNMDFVVGKVCAVDGTCLSSAIAEGIYWAVDSGAHVINMSFGDTQPSQSESQALAYAATNNVLPVCGAGNEGARVILYPAADPNCVAVTATDYGDELASYSSFGPQAELAAPGGDLENYLFGTSMIMSTYSGWDSDYAVLAGTSMAAPHVTGLGALLHALGVSTAADIRACLRGSVDDLGPAGWDEQFGWGRINMYQAVLNAGSCGGSSGGNLPPTASFTYGCDGLTCTFDGTSSWDSDGFVTSHQWDFGDGGTGSGATTAHTYAAAGEFLVTLTVTDDDGASAVSTHTVGVGTIHVGDLEGWSAAAKGNRWEAFLTVLVTQNDGAPVAGAQVSVSWTGATTGSGTSVTESDGMTFFMTQKIRGDGAVTFTVTDVSHPSLAYDPSGNTDADNDSDGTTMTVEAPNAEPQAAFTENCAALACAFTDQSTDPDGTIVSWAWDFGDGGVSAEQNPEHTYPLSFFYFVTLTVTDDKGATDSMVREIFVPPLDAGLVLTATGSKVKGRKQADLAWTGNLGAVDVRRNGSLIAEAVEGQTYTDVIGRVGETVFTYVVCETQTNVCSNEATVTF